jgi:hypothetical protein
MSKLGVETLPDLIKQLEGVVLTSALYTEINAPRAPD